nr:MAG TPA: hypothetical protein [Caudoviricetes sp.]
MEFLDLSIGLLDNLLLRIITVLKLKKLKKVLS